MNIITPRINNIFSELYLYLLCLTIFWILFIVLNVAYLKIKRLGLIRILRLYFVFYSIFCTTILNYITADFFCVVIFLCDSLLFSFMGN